MVDEIEISFTSDPDDMIDSIINSQGMWDAVYEAVQNIDIKVKLSINLEIGVKKDAD